MWAFFFLFRKKASVPQNALPQLPKSFLGNTQKALDSSAYRVPLCKNLFRRLLKTPPTVPVRACRSFVASQAHWARVCLRDFGLMVAARP